LYFLTASISGLSEFDTRTPGKLGKNLAFRQTFAETVDFCVVFGYNEYTKYLRKDTAL